METTWDGLPVAAEPPYACCVVIWRDAGRGREFLVLHRLAPGGPGFEGDWSWTPPSGARQPGETAEAAAARELSEETGLSLAFIAVPGAPSDDDGALYAARAPVDANVVLDAEHDRFMWVTLEDALARCRPPQVAAGLAHVADWLDARDPG